MSRNARGLVSHWRHTLPKQTEFGIWKRGQPRDTEEVISLLAQNFLAGIQKTAVELWSINNLVFVCTWRHKLIQIVVGPIVYNEVFRICTLAKNQWKILKCRHFYLVYITINLPSPWSDGIEISLPLYFFAFRQFFINLFFFFSFFLSPHSTLLKSLFLRIIPPCELLPLRFSPGKFLFPRFHRISARVRQSSATYTSISDSPNSSKLLAQFQVQL